MLTLTTMQEKIKVKYKNWITQNVSSKARTNFYRISMLGHKARNKSNEIPNLPYINHLISIIPMQILVEKIAKLKQINLDMPRHIIKIVTV